MLPLRFRFLAVDAVNRDLSKGERQMSLIFMDDVVQGRKWLTLAGIATVFLVGSFAGIAHFRLPSTLGVLAAFGVIMSGLGLAALISARIEGRKTLQPQPDHRPSPWLPPTSTRSSAKTAGQDAQPVRRSQRIVENAQ
jgi:hypothetical protein